MINFVSRFPLMDADPAAAGGGAATAAGFDPIAFEAKIFAEMNKTLNGFSKSLLRDVSKILKPAEPPPPTDPPTDPPSDPGSPPVAPKSTDPVVNSELAKLRREMAARDKKLDELIASNAAKDSQLKETNRLSAIRSAVDEISFKDASSKSLFLKSIVGDIAYDEDGQLVAKTDQGAVTVSEYVKSQANLTPALLAPQGGGGAGARPGQGVGGGTGKISLSKDLTPEAISKWTPEQYTAVMAKVTAGEVTA